MVNRIDKDQLDRFAERVETALTLHGYLLAMRAQQPCSYEFEFVRGEHGRFDDIKEYAYSPLKGEKRTIIVERMTQDTANVRLIFGPELIEDNFIQIGFGEDTA